MSWTLRDAERERAITDRIDQGDDRSAGILAGALIQDRLIKAIKARFIVDTKVQNSVFKGYGPLSNFKSQIDIAYLMGIIEKAARDDLHLIREIRNKFAHHLEVHDFTTNPTKDLCDKLWNISKIRKFKDFLESRLEGDLLKVISLWLGPIVTLPETSRNAYMGTIKVHLFWMEMGTTFVELDKIQGGSNIELHLAASGEEGSLPGKPEEQPPHLPQRQDRAQRKPRRRRGASPATLGEGSTG